MIGAYPAVARPLETRRTPALLLPIHLAAVGVVITGLAATVAAGAYEPSGNHDAIALGAGLALLVLIGYTRYALRFPWFSASTVYLMLLWIFHFGLAFTSIVAPDVTSDMQYWELAWLYMPNARLAMLLAALGGAGFVCGAALFPPVSGGAARAMPRQAGSPTMHAVGWGLMVIGIITSLVLLALYAGVGILSISYIELMTVVMQEGRLPLAMDVAQLGCLLAVCGAEPDRALRPLFAWAPFGALLLVLGLRNDALVPLAAFAIVLAHRGVHFRRSVLLATAAIALVIVPAIKNFRAVGFSNRSEVAWAGESPLAALTEFGSTLHAAAAYIDWIDEGDELQWGAGYWAPVDRQVLVRLMPWRTAPALNEDPRIPSRNITSVGSIGLSATGEAYYNFGVFGPFLFYGCVGALLAWLERRASATPYRAAILGIALLVLFFNIRSSWLPVPGRAGMALAVVGACHLLGRRRQEYLPGPAAPSTA